ncbi:MAG TPA: peptidylprolyl isomerase [Ignavibacteriales bacterium]|nr:peptidylprolyl isomerase [Ignavibacteriales bacterium]
MKKYFLFGLLFFVSIKISAQVEDQIVAKVGKSAITASEIKERFALTPWPKGQNDKRSQDPKSDFIYTLIAEKLLAQKASDLGYDSSAVIRSAFKTVEKMYVRDALFKHEISSRVSLSAGEIDKATKKNRYKLKVDCLKAQDEKEVQALYSSLKKGVPFNSLLKNNSALPKDSLLEVSFGELDSTLEGMLYSLKPGNFTPPVSTPDGWIIFRLVKRIDRYAISADQREAVAGEVRKILTEKDEDVIFHDFRKKFFSGKKVDVDGYIFWSFADKVIAILNEKQKDSNIKDKEKAFLTASDFLKIEQEFGQDSLKMTFVKLDSDPVSLKQFIEEIAFDGFFSNTVEARTLRAKLDSRVKDYIEKELLAREGLKMGLQNLPDVKRSLKMWRDSYLAELMKSRLMDSVKTAPTDTESLELEDAQKEDTAKAPIMVNIVEVLTDSLSTVEKVFDGLKNNVDMHELARRYTKRVWTKEKGGEFGFFPSSAYGEIGRIAGKMNIGDVYGPLKTEDGYSVFKLIDKKKDDSSLNGGKDAKHSTLTQKDILTRKYLKKLTGYTVSLAKSYGVRVNEDALNSVEALNLNIFAYRAMGFGGRLMAVPLTVPFTNWVKPWKESQNMP